MVTSFYFVITNYYYVFKWKLIYDFIWSHVYFARTWIIFYFASGSWLAMFKLYFFMRVLESMWFTWVTAMNHFPMEVDVDKNEDWVNSQLHATQNITSNSFMNWFTGHLNYQIEHHLFPTMPRHNYPKIAEKVKIFCKKHNVQYKQVGLMCACKEILGSLRVAAETHVKLTTSK